MFECGVVLGLFVKWFVDRVVEAGFESYEVDVSVKVVVVFGVYFVFEVCL